MSLSVGTHAEGIVTVTVDNPSRSNALDLGMFRALAALWPQIEADRSVRCVLLSGQGEKSFCAGADLNVDWASVEDRDALIDAALLKTRVLSKPIVAAINGDCVAGGLELMLASDVRAARVGARFGLPEVRWGIFPAGGAAMKLPEQIGYCHAMELLLTGDLIDAEGAARMGLIGRVLPSELLEDWGWRTCRRIATNSPAAVQGVKAYCVRSRAERFGREWVLEQSEMDRVRESGEQEEGVRAFLEKRQPLYLRRD